MNSVPPRGLGVALLGLWVLVVACGQPSGETEADWGAEAVTFYESLSAEYVAADYYGVLDFYEADTYREIWRGSIRGGAMVRDLLLWNAGDLGHQIEGVFLGPSGALTLARWDDGGGLSVVLSGIEDGRISSEVVYDHGAWLDASFRASAPVLDVYGHLYTTYASAWSADREESLPAVYTSDALVHLADGSNVTGIDRAVASTPLAVIDEITLEATVNSVDVLGPAIFLGPSEFGTDPRRAIALYDLTDREDCTRRVAVVWELTDGTIHSERRYEEASPGSPSCTGASGWEGWWTGIGLPPPSDEIITGTLRTAGGREIDVYNGTAGLEAFLLSSFDRFAAAGIPEPRFDLVKFEPSRSCTNRSGRLIQDQDSRDLFLCLFESDLCPTQPACEVPHLIVRSSVLHELAHAWILDNVDGQAQEELLEMSGREIWDGETVTWPERGVEYAAEVLTWGLLEEPSRMVRIGQPDCAELLRAFRLLTGVDPLREACDES